MPVHGCNNYAALIVMVPVGSSVDSETSLLCQKKVRRLTQHCLWYLLPDLAESETTACTNGQGRRLQIQESWCSAFAASARRNFACSAWSALYART